MLNNAKINIHLMYQQTKLEMLDKTATGEVCGSRVLSVSAVSESDRNQGSRIKIHSNGLMSHNQDHDDVRLSKATERTQER